MGLSSSFFKEQQILWHKIKGIHYIYANELETQV